MTIETNLHGRLRNTKLSKSNGLLPLFEALVNSIHGLEEARIPLREGIIQVVIEREKSPLFETSADDTISGRPVSGDIVSFCVVDNGVGFNETNFNSFKTLDTDHKVRKGGRGIGRLLWLKAFDRVDIASCFLNDDDTLEHRTFSFSKGGITGNNVRAATDEAKRETTVHLVGFKQNYRTHTRKTRRAIARAMVEHCLWYFVRSGDIPKISVRDNGKETLLADLFEDLVHLSDVTDRIEVKGHHFELLHVQLRASASMTHLIAYCANGRLVTKEKLSNHIPGLPDRLSDGEDEFVHMCYVSSDLLNEQVRPERDSFEIPTDSTKLFDDIEIGWSDIRNYVVNSISEHLEEHLDQVKNRAQVRLHEFVSKKAPRYRPILQHFEPTELNIDPEISDNELEQALHCKYAELEGQLVTEGQALMKLQGGESTDDYKARIESYLQKVEDIKKSDLANYVIHRRVITDLLSAAIERRPDGSYVREDLIHRLIMPMRVESSEVLQDNCNLWLVDERLAFHDYLASDKTMSAMPVTESSSTMEPDLFALNVIDTPILVAESPTPPLASIVVIELKRPMRNDAAKGEKKSDRANSWVS